MRFGIGYDVHKLVSGRDLVLGGVQIPFEQGLDGHSDADVLIHAMMDALLGAGALGDIGKHFPDNDQQYKGISSLKLLGLVLEVLKNNRFEVNNIDSVIVAQRPKVAPFIEEMRANICNVLKIEQSRVSVKATTTEGLGFAGKGEGIAAYAVASLKEG